MEGKFMCQSTRAQQALRYFAQHKTWMEDRIESGIEANRKGDALITITDKNGCAIKNAGVHLNQTEHEFRFGANLFMLDELETEEKKEAYKKHFAETFNMATLPFYWNTLEPEKGETRYEKDSVKIYADLPPIYVLNFAKSTALSLVNTLWLTNLCSLNGSLHLVLIKLKLSLKDDIKKLQNAIKTKFEPLK